MRAKFVFEKFTEDSDPIKDMDIGISWETLRPGVILEILNSYPSIKKVKGSILKITSVEILPTGRKSIKYTWIKNLSSGDYHVSWRFDKKWFKENFKILGIEKP